MANDHSADPAVAGPDVDNEQRLVRPYVRRHERMRAEHEPEVAPDSPPILAAQSAQGDRHAREPAHAAPPMPDPEAIADTVAAAVTVHRGRRIPLVAGGGALTLALTAIVLAVNIGGPATSTGSDPPPG